VLARRAAFRRGRSARHHLARADVSGRVLQVVAEVLDPVHLGRAAAGQNLENGKRLSVSNDEQGGDQPRAALAVDKPMRCAWAWGVTCRFTKLLARL
jgi:hypothetical protein